MAKRVYNKSLTATERHRVADAVYRMRRQGFIIPAEVLSKIKDASSYEAIEKKIVSMKGVEFRAIRKTKTGREYRAEGGPSAKTAYKVLKAFPKYERERKKAIEQGKALERDLPAYKPEALGPDWRETKGWTQAQINRAYEERFRRVLIRMKKSPLKRSEEIINQKVENLLKCMRHTVKQYSPELYTEIRSKLKSMSTRELYDLYDRVGNNVLDAMYSYMPELIKTGVYVVDGGSDMAINVFLKELGLDPSKEIKVGGKYVTIETIING